MAKKREVESAAVWVDAEELVPWQDNPRLNEEAVGKVEESIRRFGFSSPIIARQADRTVIAGHTRLEAARRLGITRVPVRFMDLDPADSRLLALADNRLGEVAEWDEPALARVLRDLYDEGRVMDIDIAGFSEEDLEELFDAHIDIDATVGEDPFAEPPAADEAVSFIFGEHRGRVDRSVYLSFVTEYEKQKGAADASPMLSDVLRGWLDVR